MNAPYRTPDTDLRAEKLREDAATARVRIEATELTKRVKIQTRGDGWVAPWLSVSAMLVGLGYIAYQAYSLKLEATAPKQCHDETLSGKFEMRCTSSDAVGVMKDDKLVCTCPRVSDVDRMRAKIEASE
jgi:hypothetical protein